jgi:archaellum component FlaC
MLELRKGQQSLAALKSKESDARKQQYYDATSNMMRYNICLPTSQLFQAVETGNWDKVGKIFDDLYDSKNISESTGCMDLTVFQQRFALAAQKVDRKSLINGGRSAVWSRIPEWSRCVQASVVAGVLMALIACVTLWAMTSLGSQAVSWYSKPADPSAQARIDALEKNYTYLMGNFTALKNKVNMLEDTNADSEALRDENAKAAIDAQNAKVSAALEASSREWSEKLKVRIDRHEELIKTLNTRNIMALDESAKMKTAVKKFGENVSELLKQVEGIEARVTPVSEKLNRVERKAGAVESSVGTAERMVGDLQADLQRVMSGWYNQYSFQLTFILAVVVFMCVMAAWVKEVLRPVLELKDFALDTSHKFKTISGEVKTISDRVNVLERRKRVASGVPAGPGKGPN